MMDRLHLRRMPPLGRSPAALADAERGEESTDTRDRPVPGTWVRLARMSYPMSLWHEVTGWHEGHLELACVDCDRVISWALRPGGEYHVERRRTRPLEDACDYCLTYAVELPVRAAA